ncbi:MAG: DNA polymerase/3'-5' exonuclease PolX, partial [Thermoguttaceae bacterium]
MTNSEIADTFDSVADILEFQGANQFRVRAYRNAARTIRDLPESMADLAADSSRKLTDIEGIGKDLAEKIASLVTTGKLEMLEELKQQVPESVMSMMRVPGLGPKRAAMLFKELKVTSLEELRAACDAHKVRELKGLGAKTEESILAGLQFAAEADKRVLWAEADDLVREILEYMRSCPAVEQIEAAGSYRRGRETVGDLDLLAVAAGAAVVMDHMAAYPSLAEVQARGETKLTARLRTGLHLDLRVVPAESFGAAMQYFTGSKAHNVVVRGLAKDRGLKVNEYGVFRGDEQIAGRSEEDVYAALDLPWFPPEMREARREFQWAADGELPRLIELRDIRGDLHMHSTWTDGQATIEEMALAARARGLKYIAMTDHSKRVTMVNGLDENRLLQQWEEIDRLNERLTGITVLKGVEVDILERGGLDLSDDVLKEADWVNASIHYGQNQSREQITRRVVDALQN